MRYVVSSLLCVICSVFLFISGCNSNNSNKQDALRKPVILAATTLLATIPDEDKPKSQAPSGPAIHTVPVSPIEFIFNERGGAVAYIIEKGDRSHVVHNGNVGNPYKSVGNLVLSPDGKRIAYGALIDGKWRMVIDGVEGTLYNTVKSPVFSPDSLHIAYQAMAGERWYLVVDSLPSSGTLKRYLNHEFSADSSKVIYVDDVDDTGAGSLVVSDLVFKQQRIVAPNVSLLITNIDKSRMAAVCINNGLQNVIEFGLHNLEAVKIKSGQSYNSIQKLAFGPDGTTLAYIAELTGKRIISYKGKEEELPEGSVVEFPVIHPDGKSVVILISSNNGVKLNSYFSTTPILDKPYEEASGFVYNKNGEYAYTARKGNKWFVVVNGVDGQEFDRVVSPKFSPNGKNLIYRARKDGKRFVVVATSNGKILRQLPPHDQVFDVVFTEDNKSIAYGVKDGQKLVWQVDGI